MFCDGEKCHFLAQKKLKKRHQMGIFRSKNLERF